MDLHPSKSLAATLHPSGAVASFGPAHAPHAAARRRRARRRLAGLLGLVVAGLASLAVAQPAGAGTRYAVEFNGIGTYAVNDGAAEFVGVTTGRPVDGDHVGRLSAADGTLPVPGECEPADATFRVDGAKGRFLDMGISGTVCGLWVGTGNVVTHAFTGRYLVEAGKPKRFVGTDGFFEIRLTDDGRAVVFAIST